MFTEQTRLFWNFSYLQDLPQNSAFLPGITRNVLQHTFICHFYLHGPCRVAVMEPLDGRVVYRTRGSASTRIQTVISRTGGSFFLNLKENCVLVVAERRRRRELVAKITESEGCSTGLSFFETFILGYMVGYGFHWIDQAEIFGIGITLNILLFKGVDRFQFSDIISFLTIQEPSSYRQHDEEVIDSSIRGSAVYL